MEPKYTQKSNFKIYKGLELVPKNKKDEDISFSDIENDYVLKLSTLNDLKENELINFPQYLYFLNNINSFYSESNKGFTSFITRERHQFSLD